MAEKEKSFKKFSKYLAGLFDFQKFEQNPALDSVIKSAESDLENGSLAESDLGMLSAAGTGVDINHKFSKKP